MTSGYRKYLAPRHWPIWLLLALQRILVWLPWPMQRGIGRVIGFLALNLASERAAIARQNIKLTMPELTGGEQRQLLKQHFAALGIGIMEMGMAWWARDTRIQKLCDVSGLEHLHKSADRSMLIVSGHFTTIDMQCRALGLFSEFDALYRPLGIGLLDKVMRRGRLRSTQALIDKHSPRALLKSIQRGHRIWIAVDQADSTRSAVKGLFFGQPVATNTTVSRLTAKHACQIVAVSCRRQDNHRYQIQIVPIAANINGTDAVADANALNAVIEAQARQAPAQYYWVHRRFKRVGAASQDV